MSNDKIQAHLQFCYVSQSSGSMPICQTFRSASNTHTQTEKKKKDRIWHSKKCSLDGKQKSDENSKQMKIELPAKLDAEKCKLRPQKKKISELVKKLW